MGKIIILISIIILLSACCEPIRVHTEVQETLVPILYSPSPPKIQRPVLPIHQMTEDELASDGTIVKYYKATIQTLIGYSLELEAALHKYNDIHNAYEKKRQTLDEELKKQLPENVDGITTGNNKQIQ